MNGGEQRSSLNNFLIVLLSFSAGVAAAQPGGDPGELDGAARHVGLAAVRTLELGDARLQDRIQVSERASCDWNMG